MINIPKETKQTQQSEKAYQMIKDMIFKKELRPGSPIIANSFYKDFGMSRTPVREAIARLSSEGLVELIPNRGAFVKTFTIKELIMCYEVAAALEGVLVYNIAKRYSTAPDRAMLEKLHKIVDYMNLCEKENKWLEWIGKDEEFHNTLLQCSDNYILTDHIKMLSGQFKLMSLFFSSQLYSMEISNIEHTNILKYIEAGDATSASNEMQKHRKRIKSELETVLNSDNPIYQI